MGVEILYQAERIPIQYEKYIGNTVSTSQYEIAKKECQRLRAIRPFPLGTIVDGPTATACVESEAKESCRNHSPLWSAPNYNNPDYSSICQISVVGLLGHPG